MALSGWCASYEPKHYTTLIYAGIWPYQREPLDLPYRLQLGYGPFNIVQNCEFVLENRKCRYVPVQQPTDQVQFFMVHTIAGIMLAEICKKRLCRL